MQTWQLWEREQHGHHRSVTAEAAATAAAKGAATTAGAVWRLVPCSRCGQVGHQHRHSQPTSAPKATISTINVSTGIRIMVALLRGPAIRRRRVQDRE
jgi:hypothetical protein